MSHPIIGRRWHPGHYRHRDPITGEYAEMNPPMSPANELLQRVLIEKPQPAPHLVWPWVVAGLAVLVVLGVK